MKQLLTTQQEDLLKRERQWLTDLQVVLSQLGVTQEDQETLTRSIQQLDELFLLVIVGEFNAGKSAFINALLGQPLLKEGVTPTTAQINVLYHGEVSKREILSPHMHRLTEPVELLQQIHIVDTPGTNAIIREHEEITERFVPRSDLVLFITSADRPFTESERNFLQHIRDWGKKVVLVINKIDMFQTNADLQQVIDFVREHAAALLNTTPEIFPISSRQAIQGKQGDAAMWESSRFKPLEDFIYNTLDETSRVRLKFLNPLGVGDNLLKKYADITQTRLEVLRDDVDMIDNLDRQLRLYREDMQRDFKFRIADIENVLHDMQRRGDEFFEETMRLTRIVDLLNKKQFQTAFEAKVIMDVPQRIEQKVLEMIDWLVNADLNQWQAVMDYLDERKQEYKARIIGDTGSAFRYDRDRMLDSVGRSARQVVETYNKSAEAERMANQAQRAIAEMAAIGAGGFGLGAVIVAATASLAVDVTGILMGLGVILLGTVVIPMRKRTAKKEMATRTADLRERLSKAISAQFEKELNRSIERINEAVTPYTRFVRSEQQKLKESEASLKDAQTMQSQLRAQIEALLVNE